MNVWTIWRRPRDTEQPWLPFVSVRGGKRDCLAVMQELDRTTPEIDFEYHALPGDAKPPLRRPRPLGW